MSDHIAQYLDQHGTKFHQFIGEIMNLRREYAELERELIDTDVTWTTLFSRKNLSQLNRRYSNLSDRGAMIAKARSDLNYLTDIDSVDDGELTDEELEVFMANFPMIDQNIEQINQISGRVGRRLTNKTDTANTRLSLLISVSAILLSITGIILNIVQ